MKKYLTPLIFCILIALSTNAISQTGSSCNDAIVAVQGTNSYTNAGSSPVWFQYTATKDSRVEITTCGFAYPLFLTTFPNCTTSDSLETFKQSCPASSVDRDKAFFYAFANQTYYLRWKNPAGNSAISFNWNLTEATLSPGEICSNALPLLIGTNNTGKNLVHWYAYTTSGNDPEKIIVTSCGNNSFYSQIRFSCGDNDFERSAKHNQCGASTTTQFEALPGTTYFLKVYPTENNTFNVTKLVPAPGEVCSNPIPAFTGTNHADHTNNTDQWFVYTPFQTGVITFSNIPFGGDYELRLYHSCASSAFSIILNQSNASVNVTANQPLYILLRTRTSFSYNWNINVPVNNINIALNKPASSSSNEVASLSASNANDGNASSRWSSKFSDPQWVSVDLQANYNISRVVLKWEAASAMKYNIEVSNDNMNWNIAKIVSNGAGGIETWNLTGITGRYIRMNGLTRNTVYGYSLWEFEVYGSPAGFNQPPVSKPGNDTTVTLPVNSLVLNGSSSMDPDGTIVGFTWTQLIGPNTATLVNDHTSIVTVSNLIGGTYTFNLKVTDNLGLSASKNINVVVNSNIPVNIALNKPVITKSIETGYPATNVNDGNNATRWSTQFSDPQWIRIDLQGNYSINRVVLNWETASAKAYTLEVSDNDIDFTPIQTVSNGNGGIESWDFQNVTARYIRMYGTVRNTVWGYSLWEFEVYGLAIKSEPFVAPAGNNPTSDYVTVYPNPFKDNLTINPGTVNDFRIAKIYDLSGKLLMSWNLAPGEVEITQNLSSLKSGFYILKLEGTKTKMLSLIKD